MQLHSGRSYFCLMKTPGCAGEFKKALAFHMKKKLLLIQ